MTNESLADLLGPVEQPPSSDSPPPVNLNDPVVLRTDGPTLAEFVAAGYAAEAYPPQGYAAVSDPVENAPVVSESESSVSDPVESEPIVSAPVVAESWRACTGPDISAMIKASQLGFERTPGFTKADVYNFLASKEV